MVGVAGRFYKSCEVRIATTRTKTLLPRTFQKAVTLEFHVILLFLLPAISMAELVLNQKYKLASSENFEEFMKALGVGVFTRKVGGAVSPVIELTEKDGVYTLSSSSTFKDSVISFRLGEEFDEETPDGRHVKSIITQEGNKLIHVQKGDKNTKIIREFTPEEVKMTLTVDDIVCTRVYKKLE